MNSSHTEQPHHSQDTRYDVADGLQEVWETCAEQLIDETEEASDWDLEDLDGVYVVNDDGEMAGVSLLAGQSYGQNHLMVRGFSSDPRDEEIFEDLFDALKERFEEGPEDE